MKKEILSPMPGTVIKLLVAEGESLVEGQDAVVIESMKMENFIKSPVAGKVAQVLVAPEEKVAARQVLVRLE